MIDHASPGGRIRVRDPFPWSHPMQRFFILAAAVTLSLATLGVADANDGYCPDCGPGGHGGLGGHGHGHGHGGHAGGLHKKHDHLGKVHSGQKLIKMHKMLTLGH
jgi:hypothetical protein